MLQSLRKHIASLSTWLLMRRDLARCGTLDGTLHPAVASCICYACSTASCLRADSALCQSARTCPPQRGLLVVATGPNLVNSGAINTKWLSRHAKGRFVARTSGKFELQGYRCQGIAARVSLFTLFDTLPGHHSPHSIVTQSQEHSHSQDKRHGEKGSHLPGGDQ